MLFISIYIISLGVASNTMLNKYTWKGRLFSSSWRKNFLSFSVGYGVGGNFSCITLIMLTSFDSWLSVFIMKGCSIVLTTETTENTTWLLSWWRIVVLPWGISLIDFCLSNYPLILFSYGVWVFSSSLLNSICLCFCWNFDINIHQVNWSLIFFSWRIISWPWYLDTAGLL